MKNKILIILLFILFAIPIPISILVIPMCVIWILGVLIAEFHFLEIIKALIMIIISTSYLFIYVYALKKTWVENKITAKTFLPIAHYLLTFVAFLILINPIDSYIDQTTKYFGFTKKDFLVVEELDTHGGFPVDGSHYLILDCSNNKAKALEIVKDWNKLPLPENLNYIMYGEIRDGSPYGDELAQEAHIPKIKNGYYIFENRDAESKDSIELIDKRPDHFTIAIYDYDTHKMYYFKFDL
ncbi:MAG: hypothetical protein J6R68_01525 [Clostridia bacterium]|nr:hypothetical protein [Clostridia bacterium]MBO7288701.1 hypothetical protein [Clostridia bacterium]